MSTLDALVLASEIKRNENKINNLKNAATIVRVKPVSVNAAGVTGNPAVAIQRSFSEVVIRRDRSQDPVAPGQYAPSGPLATSPAQTELTPLDRDFMRGKFRSMLKSQASNYEELLELCVAQEEEALYRTHFACKLNYFKQGFRNERLIREVAAKRTEEAKPDVKVEVKHVTETTKLKMESNNSNTGQSEAFGLKRRIVSEEDQIVETSSKKHAGAEVGCTASKRAKA